MTHQPSQDQDLRTALHKAVSTALHNNQFADGWPEMVDPVVDAVLALTPAQAPDKAGEREGLDTLFWLELREPKRVPERKGPWSLSKTADILREFMKARPTAYITVVTVGDDGPDFEDGPQALQTADGRSMSTGSNHIRRSACAHDGLRTALAEAEARGRRQGLEEAAKLTEHWSLNRISREIRALATAPSETQETETGESHS